MKKGFVVMLLLIVGFTLSGNISFASNPQVNSIAASKILSVSQIADVKGKYTSVEELLKETGWTATPADNIDKSIGRIEISSMDELAALLNKEPILKVEPQSSFGIITPYDVGVPPSGSFDSTKTIYSDALATVKMYSTAYYYGDSITSATCSSGISGVTIGISWSQTNANANKVTNNHWITSVTGTYSYYIGWEGIGTLYSKTLNGTDNLIKY